MALAGGVLLLAGCAHLNEPLRQFNAQAGYRFANLSRGTNSDEVFIILACSGGGTRAAAFAYGALEQLRTNQIAVEGATKRVLDEVDVISSVSGGSFPAAYYALYGERLFVDFPDRFLNKDIQGALFWNIALRPQNWVRLASPWFSRSDLAAEYYDRQLFGGASYSNLLARGRPFLMVNATDMTLGAPLEFTQAQFDFLYSDLLPLSVARAVTASSAFPGLLAPITLRNFPAGPAYQPLPWIALALEDRDLNLRRYRHAVRLQSYLDKTNRPYLHLLDGGVADNLGLRGPLWSLESGDWEWSLRRDIENGKVKTVVIISVDARTEPAVQWDRRARVPGAVPVLAAAGVEPMANYSFETAMRLQEKFKAWQQEGALYALLRNALRDPAQQSWYAHTPQHDVRYYAVHLSFEAIREEAWRHYCNNIDTSFCLSTNEVANLRLWGAKLLKQNAAYQKFLKDYAP
jgi:predicted acylesterase/phospholipase RssA